MQLNAKGPVGASYHPPSVLHPLWHDVGDCTFNQRDHPAEEPHLRVTETEIEQPRILLLGLCGQLLRKYGRCRRKAALSLENWFVLLNY